MSVATSSNYWNDGNPNEDIADEFRKLFEPLDIRNPGMAPLEIKVPVKTGQHCRDELFKGNGAFICFGCRQIESIDTIKEHYIDKPNTPRHLLHGKLKQLVETVKHFPYLDSFQKLLSHWENEFVKIRQAVNVIQDQTGVKLIYCLAIVPDVTTESGFGIKPYICDASVQVDCDVDEAVKYFMHQYNNDFILVEMATNKCPPNSGFDHKTKNLKFAEIEPLHVEEKELENSTEKL